MVENFAHLCMNKTRGYDAASEQQTEADLIACKLQRHEPGADVSVCFHLWRPTCVKKRSLIRKSLCFFFFLTGE